MNAPVAFLYALFPIHADYPKRAGNDTHAAANAARLVHDNRSMGCSLQCCGGAGFGAGAFFAMHAAQGH